MLNDILRSRCASRGRSEPGAPTTPADTGHAAHARETEEWSALEVPVLPVLFRVAVEAGACRLDDAVVGSNPARAEELTRSSEDAPGHAPDAALPLLFPPIDTAHAADTGDHDACWQQRPRARFHGLLDAAPVPSASVQRDSALCHQAARHRSDQ
jgi:hypothetical protein